MQACKEIESLHFDSTLTDHSTTATPNGTSHTQHHHQPRRRNSLEQEVSLLREENDSLNNTLRTKEEELQKMKGNLITIRDERDKLRRKVKFGTLAIRHIRLFFMLVVNYGLGGGKKHSKFRLSVHSGQPKHELDSPKQCWGCPAAK